LLVAEEPKQFVLFRSAQSHFGALLAKDEAASTKLGLSWWRVLVLSVPAAVI
jgi:hypothetical protein